MNDADGQKMSAHELEVESAQSKLAAYAALGSAAAVLVAVGLDVMATKGADFKSKVSLLTTMHDHSAQFILASLFRTVSFALLAIVLGFLAIAVKRRMPMLPGLTVPVAYAGAALSAIAAPIIMLAQVDAAKTFAEGSVHTLKAAEQAIGGGFVTVAQYAAVFATMLLAVSWIVIGLYALRCGLLTRLVAGVAIAIGVLTVLGVFQPSRLALLLQFFWLIAVAVMLLATDETKPPAWRIGAAINWREVDAARAQVDESERD